VGESGVRQVYDVVGWEDCEGNAVVSVGFDWVDGEVGAALVVAGVGMRRAGTDTRAERGLRIVRERVL
jgi:hypothetical protein